MAGPTISAEMMENPWQLVDLAQIRETLKELEDLLLCSRCGKLPARGGDPDDPSFPLVTLVTTCGHSICGSNPACGPYFTGGGPCPVEGCGVHASAKDLKPDLDQTSRIEAVIGLRSTMDLEEKDELLKQVPVGGATGSKPSKRGRKKKAASSSSLTTSLAQSPVKAAKKESKLKGRRNHCQADDDFVALAEKEAAAKRGVYKAASRTKNINKRNAKGETLLHCACRKLEEEKVESLLKERAETNTQDYAGWTPLHEVAQRSHYGLVSLLLDHGVNPNVPGGDDNFTPLHDAVQAGDPDVVRLLIEKGAKKDVRDAAGNTPRDLATNLAVLSVVDNTACQVTEEELDQTVMGNGIVESGSPLLSRNQVINLDHMSCKNDPARLDMLKGLEAKLKPRQSKAFIVECKSTKLNPNLTHFVVGRVNDSYQVEADDTTQLSAYYEALMLGAWIVGCDWVSVSAKAGKFVPEEGFEVRGVVKQAHGAPERARFTRMRKLPKLLDGTNIYLHGTFSKPYPDKTQLTEILKKGGASVLKREPDPEAISIAERKLPYHAEPQGPLAKCSHFIIYQEGTKGEPLIKYKMDHIKTLPAAWLFECLDNYRLVDPFA